jgi:hypothetical protein
MPALKGRAVYVPLPKLRILVSFLTNKILSSLLLLPHLPIEEDLCFRMLRLLIEMPLTLPAHSNYQEG